MIERASVEGKVFHTGWLAEAAPEPTGPSVKTQLTGLVRKELIRPAKPVFAGEDAFRFRHLLIRDAVYDSIPKQVRAALHERHADWLEAKAGAQPVEYEEIIGYHLEQAFRCRAELGPVDETAQAVGHRAAERLGAAGRRALDRSDASAALNLISRAVLLLPPDDPARVDLVPAVRTIQGVSADLSWAHAVLGEAIAAGDERLKVHALVQQAFLRLFTESEVAPGELIEVAEQAIGVLEELGDELGLARAWRLIAQAHYLARRAGASAEASEQALVHARRAGDRFEERESVESLGVVLFAGPVPAVEAAQRLDQLLAERRGEPLHDAFLAVVLTNLQAMQGRTVETRDLLAHAGPAIDTRGEKRFSVELVLELSMIALWQDDPVAAERELGSSYDALKKVGEKDLFSITASLLAHAVYRQGRYEEAEELTREGEQAARLNDVHAQVIWRAARAKVLARKGELEAAEAFARDAVAFAAESDFIIAHGDALVAQAEVLRLAGRPAEAASAIDRAVALFQQKGAVVAADNLHGLLEELRAAAT